MTSKETIEELQRVRGFLSDKDYSDYQIVGEKRCECGAIKGSIYASVGGFEKPLAVAIRAIKRLETCDLNQMLLVFRCPTCKRRLDFKLDKKKEGFNYCPFCGGKITRDAN